MFARPPGSLLAGVFLFALIGAAPLFAGAVLSIYEAPHTALDTELDPYYTSLDFYIFPFGST
ncbi:MAG: hypothetical protein JNM63_11250, partial [Spirochaetia bacterium]|nr:hypothetical protein [Spirochaetia bacterium]